MLLCPHPGAPARPLQRGASGGELSRVMLAVEVVFAGADPVPTFVFDEVDAGVGGKAAVEVGRRLALLARTAQVIVVTHLPQVAAFADQHLVVRKAERRLGHQQRGQRARRRRARAGALPHARRHRGVRGGRRRTRASCWRRPGPARRGDLSHLAARPPHGLVTVPVSRRFGPGHRRVRVAGWSAMRIATLRRARKQPELPGLTGTARVDARTKNLTKRLRPGDIAVIDHLDLDKVSAEALVAARVGGRGQRRAQHQRALSQPRSRDPRRRRHPAARRRRARGDARRSRRASSSGCTRTRSTATHDVVAKGEVLTVRERPGRDGGGPGRARRAARGVRRQHDGVPPPGARAAARRRRRAGHPHPHRGPARADRRARLPLQGGPGDPAPLHPRVPAGPDRRRRRRGRAARGRLPART